MVLVDYIEDRNRLRVVFPFDRRSVEAVKTISGRKYSPREKGGPAWEIPANIRYARRLREIFGDMLRLTDAASEWGKSQISVESDLRRYGGAADASLSVLPAELPDLFEFVSS